MNYKALVTADWHLSNALPHSRPANDSRHEVTDRLGDQLRVISKIKELAHNEKVDSIIVLGDVFDRRLVDAVTLSAGVEAIRELSDVAPVWLLPGNHDANSQRGDRFLIEAFGEMNFPNVLYMGGYQGISPEGYKWLVFYPVPWSPLSAARIRIQDARMQRDTSSVSVLMLHQGINGCKDGGWVCENELDPNETCDGFDLVISGHFHDPQSFGACGYYVGAPMAHDFRDAGGPYRGVMVVTFSPNKRPLISNIPIRSPRFLVREWGSLVREGIRKLPRGIRRGDYLRIDVRATRSDFAVTSAEVEDYIRRLRDTGVNVLEAKHDLIPDTEDRLVVETNTSLASNFEAVIDRYLDIANIGELDAPRLSEVGKSIMREALLNDNA